MQTLGIYRVARNVRVQNEARFECVCVRVKSAKFAPLSFHFNAFSI